MIRVVRIIGETYDLDSGEELGKGLVLSNGVSEMTISVDEHTIMEVLQMHKEDLMHQGENCPECSKGYSYEEDADGPAIGEVHVEDGKSDYEGLSFGVKSI